MTVKSKTIVSNDYVTVSVNGDRVIVDMVNCLICLGGVCFSSPQIVIGSGQTTVAEMVSVKTGQSTTVVIDQGRVDYLKQS